MISRKLLASIPAASWAPVGVTRISGLGTVSLRTSLGTLVLLASVDANETHAAQDDGLAGGYWETSARELAAAVGRPVEVVSPSTGTVLRVVRP